HRYDVAQEQGRAALFVCALHGRQEHFPTARQATDQCRPASARQPKLTESPPSASPNGASPFINQALADFIWSGEILTTYGHPKRPRCCAPPAFRAPGPIPLHAPATNDVDVSDANDRRPPPILRTTSQG